MTAPINNNLRNIPPSGLSSHTDSDQQVDGNQSIAQGSSAAIEPLAGNHRLLPGTGQDIDWFSDLDAGSKLPITVNDRLNNRLQGKSIQEMVDIIMGHLGLRT